MPDPHSDDATLPSLDTALPGLRPRLSLIATIVFHPDLTRVGEYAVMHRSRLPVVLGRESGINTHSGFGGASRPKGVEVAAGERAHGDNLWQ